MSTEKTFVNDGSYLTAAEENRSWVQLFPNDQSKDAGVWSIRYRQDVKTFRSTSFPLSTITHTASSKSLTNPNTGALETFYLVGENITAIEHGWQVVFERIYAPEISDIETVVSQSIQIPDWNGLESSGTYSATIDNRRAAIYTARKAVTAISELEEVETIDAPDIRAPIHGTLDWDGTTTDLTQSVDDIWSDLYLTNVVSVQKDSTKIRLNANVDNIDDVNLSVSGLSSDVGYIISKGNVMEFEGYSANEKIVSSYAEIEFVYTRSLVEGTLTLQSRDPKVIYENTTGATTGLSTNSGTLTGFAGPDGDAVLVTSEPDFGLSASLTIETPSAPGSGAFLMMCELYIPVSGGVSYVRNYYDNNDVNITQKGQWVEIGVLLTGPFSGALTSFASNIGQYYIRNIKLETLDRTIDLTDTPSEIVSTIAASLALQSVIKDSESVRIIFKENSVFGINGYQLDRKIDTSWLSASVDGANSNVAHKIETDGRELRIIFADKRQVSEITTNPQSVRTLTVLSHGFIQGDTVALFAGDALVGVTTCSAVIDTNNFQIPANALPGKDDIVTHVGDKSTQSIFSSYPQTVLVETRKKVYIPGVTSGIDSLSDIPVRQGLDTPQSWLVAIAAGLVTAQIEGTQIEHPYPGLYIATESEFVMSDVLNQTDSFLADIEGTFIIADW